MLKTRIFDLLHYLGFYLDKFIIWSSGKELILFQTSPGCYLSGVQVF